VEWLISNIGAAIIGIIIGWMTEPIKRRLFLWGRDQVDSIAENLKRYPPKGSIKVTLTCLASVIGNAKEVYIAGTFNEWLSAQSGAIRPRQRYKLRKINDHWAVDVYLRPGKHEFKFVVDKVIWIPWREEFAQTYKCGSNAPGGPNFLIEVR